MAELTIRPEEIRDALDRFVQSYTPETSSREEGGTVVTSGDGIARVEGLPSAMANELLEFENGVQGIALNLDVREIGVVVMGDSEGIEEGQTVRRTGDILSVPVGDGYLGRTVNAMGVPIDGLGEIEGATERRALELQAAGELEQLEGHGRRHALDPGDAVAGLGDPPDLLPLQARPERLHVLLEGGRDLVRPDRKFGHVVPLRSPVSGLD